MSDNTKKDVLKYLVTLSCVILTLGFSHFALKLLPKAVSYSIVSEERVNKAGNIVTDREFENVLYDNVNLIPEKSEYTIKSENEEIYVFSESTALYRVKARLSDFPANDVFLLREGMTVSGKDELCEVIVYMES